MSMRTAEHTTERADTDTHTRPQTRARAVLFELRVIRSTQLRRTTTHVHDDDVDLVCGHVLQCAPPQSI